MSYLERTLWWFLKERVFGGITKLKNKYFFPFALLVAGFATTNTVLSILYQFDLFVSLEFVQSMLILQLFVALSLFIAGFVVGKIHKLYIYYLLSAGIIGGFIFIFFFFEWSYYQPLFQYTKLAIFLLWVAITCLSFFVLLLYFFTSFPKKVMMLGAPSEHVFFSPVIKFVLIISIPVYAYMILQFSPASIIIGVLGILMSILVLILVFVAPKKSETLPGITNFTGALGFFSIFLFYHLAASFSFTAYSISSLIIDILIIFITILYLIQSLTRRISDAPEKVKQYENPIRFQTRLYVTDSLKKMLGEPGLVLIVMGLALGYQMVYLDSFFITEFPILSEFFTQNLRLSALYHRVYLITSFIVIFIALILYRSSLKFKGLMEDKYTLAQVFKYIGHYFKRGENGVSPLEYGVQVLGKKVGDGIKNIGEKWVGALKEKIEPKPLEGDGADKSLPDKTGSSPGKQD